MKKAALLIGAGLLSLATFAQSKKATTTTYGKNIIRFNPINVFNHGGVGVGLGYERILTDDGKFGVKIPFHFGIRSASDWNGGMINTSITNYSLMINPGIKFYPMGQRKVTYGLGFSVFGISGSNDRYEWDGMTGITRLMAGSHRHFGMMVDNSIQFNLTPKFNIGMELGLGPSYYNGYKDGSSSWTDPLDFMAAFNFHMGFRF